ncbi:AAA family ATPase [Dactylosporangium aurantiacum]|uniref:AAA family ATPase n=1 Tax=Dactylosporangium aurantiacum TaxID=35754 RepID=A0A9Q9IT54_9ACTN|nr:AAA family ATPase [Dactylosporangium aurantiacum]MDG6108313.1 AAA family ATPase [Dactylosporangium aurantiacum]UWZ58498.1 AAA family ATPase [Dactylosporangium aurantiacum]
MGTGASRAEVVHDSEHTRVTRVVAGHPLIRKEPLGPDAPRRVQHEAAMLQRLRGVPDVAQLVDAAPRSGAITMADAGDTTLAALAKPLAARELLSLATRLARAVAAMHRHGVMHRDITPANILIGPDGAPCLVDFLLATPFAEIRPDFIHHTQIVGTLAYLAPEQTGRTGRSVDQRADLYALGATLYELATGAPPFGAGDPLRLTHDHLARVPEPPARVNPAVPGPLSDIIMHLLEKEPDDRYQTADGVVHDLERLLSGGPDAMAGLRIGEHDVPLRLLPPSRLVGRDPEVAALRAAFEDATAGRCRALLVAGPAGVGKTALVDQLRPLVAGRDGWFVAGKFDQCRHDPAFNAVHQAFRALGRLLLAEPEETLAKVRARIFEAAGANVGLLTAMLPEFATLLAVPPDTGDPLTARARVVQTVAEVLRAVASRERPLVVFTDDLQWAGPALDLVDELFSAEPVDGLLLVGTCRADDAPALARWRQLPTVRHLPLTDLDEPGLGALVAEVLHVDPARAAGLAATIRPFTAGNPHQTVELLNLLRSDGLLTAAADGWQWDDAATQRHLHGSEPADLLAARFAALPARTRHVLEAMACLGGRADVRLLQTVTAATADAVEHSLLPALDEGLLVMGSGVEGTVRLRHDQTCEAVLRSMTPRRRRARRLSIARRLAGVPELSAVAAEHYLPVIDAVREPAERRRVAALLRRTAAEAAAIGDQATVDATLAAALPLIDPADTATLAEVHTARHAALYGLGKLDDADQEYRTIERLRPDIIDRAAATGVQISSLTHRTRFAEAVRLGADSLRALGTAVPAADRLPAELDRQLGYLHDWLGRPADADRAELTDPTLRATAHVLNAVMAAAYFGEDYATHCWLGLEALRIWGEHGPHPALIGPATVACTAAVLLGDYAAAYRAGQRLLAESTARGYRPGTARARVLLAAQSHWFEPAEDGVRACRQARDELISGGDLASAGYTYYQIVSELIDVAPTLAELDAEVEAGRVFVRRTGNELTGRVLDSYRWLVAVLRGEHVADAPPEEPPVPLPDHLARGTAAAIFDDGAGLARHSAAAMVLLRTGLGPYPMDTAYLLRGLALARQARDGDGDRAAVLSELADMTDWLAARAADAPGNFLHLLRLVEAERAWAVGDFSAAAQTYDAALRAVAGQQRPWHRALITERAARFHLTHGLEHTGRALLTEARQAYLEWGATAKVDQLDWAFPARPSPPAEAGEQRAVMTTGTLDLLGILAASQALSSETDLGRLHSRVTRVVSAMTGATDVQLLLWSDDRHDWLRPAPGDDRAQPMSVVRYAQRTGEPLVVEDATRDDRFARDPYLTGVAYCALLAVPIVSRGTLRAMLLLENRLIRGAFTAGRLEAVRLIAGQLAVSLDNIKVYGDFRRIADEQTALRRVATLVARGTRPEDLFAAVAAEICALCGAEEAVIVRHEPDGSATVMGRHGPAGPPHPATAASPIVVEGRVWGAITVGSRDRRPQPQRLAAFTELVATAIANADSRAELSTSRARIVATADQTRRRIERDLHDGAQQRLVALALQLRTAQADVPPELDTLGRQLDRAVSAATAAADEVREIAHGIHPAILSQGGLGAALRTLARRSPVPVHLDVRAEVRLPEHIEVSAYYVVAEALTNTAKHAHASAVTVTVDTADSALHLAVRDDGTGGADLARGTGLLGLKDRVEAIGGRLSIDSPPGHGTNLLAQLPIGPPPA